MGYYHLSGAMLESGASILPGNWGRIIRAYSWQHNLALRETALENARQARFSKRPSRLDAAFAFLTLDEARTFRQTVNGFGQHLLYRVTLGNPAALSHITDSRFCAPIGTFRHNWADIYWMDFEAQAAAVPGIDWKTATGGVQLREVLTLSNLIIQERLD